MNKILEASQFLLDLILSIYLFLKLLTALPIWSITDAIALQWAQQSSDLFILEVTGSRYKLWLDRVFAVTTPKLCFKLTADTGTFTDQAFFFLFIGGIDYNVKKTLKKKKSNKLLETCRMRRMREESDQDKVATTFFCYLTEIPIF